MKRLQYILIVEDNIGDAHLIRYTLKAEGMNGRIEHVFDGDRGIQTLDGLIARKMPLPDLILLDLNLPRRSGFEILKEIKARPEFQAIPVYILSSSEFELDVRKSMEFGAAGYYSKPVNLEGFEKIWKQISQNFSSLEQKAAVQ